MTKVVKIPFGKRGFSLMEVIIGLMLMVMVMAGAYGIIVQAAKLSKVVRHHYVAVTIAKNRLERSRTFPYASMHLMAEDKVVVDDNGLPDPEGWYRRSTVVNTNYGPGLKEVTVSVDVRNVKTGGWGPEHEIISTLFTDYTLPGP